MLAVDGRLFPCDRTAGSTSRRTRRHRSFTRSAEFESRLDVATLDSGRSSLNRVNTLAQGWVGTTHGTFDTAGQKRSALQRHRLVDSQKLGHKQPQNVEEAFPRPALNSDRAGLVQG